jgi:glycine/serine hydroxymethyltransferase
MVEDIKFKLEVAQEGQENLEQIKTSNFKEMNVRKKKILKEFYNKYPEKNPLQRFFLSFTTIDQIKELIGYLNQQLKKIEDQNASYKLRIENV